MMGFQKGAAAGVWAIAGKNTPSRLPALAACRGYKGASRQGARRERAASNQGSAQGSEQGHFGANLVVALEGGP